MRIKWRTQSVRNWAIAAERYPNADTREKVDEIEHANGLNNPVIRPGQILKVPTG